MSRHLVWLAGRGVSMSCGLDWDVPPALEAARHAGEISRAALGERIASALERAQDDAAIDCRPIDAMLERIRGPSGWRHAFVTTNWDALLDRALERHGFEPPLHLNGSVAARNLLLEDDGESAREAVPQVREGLRRLAQAELVVVAGLSLASRLDKALVARLAGKHGGRWLVVNHDAGEVRRCCAALEQRLPGCTVQAVALPFDRWVAAGLPGLNIAPAEA
ncbi:MAG TPA: hypothetical protein VFC18_20830 [Burkholderiales bacterium]|nr:hypothetical protein [Burkholderiales bacterium]